MSQITTCPKCGEQMEVPAFEGDGVYSRHVCEQVWRVLGEKEWRPYGPNCDPAIDGPEYEVAYQGSK